MRVTLTDFYSTFYKCLKHNGEYSLKNKEEIFKFQNLVPTTNKSPMPKYVHELVIKGEELQKNYIQENKITYTSRSEERRVGKECW